VTQGLPQGKCTPDAPHRGGNNNRYAVLVFLTPSVRRGAATTDSDYEWIFMHDATLAHMPIFDALALVRSPHLGGLATSQGNFHDLWPRTVARTLTTMGFLRHWGDVVFVNTLHPNRAQRAVKLSSSSP